jgi:hypothetical protein
MLFMGKLDGHFSIFRLIGRMWPSCPNLAPRPSQAADAA